jgi:uncharacterized membrane protein YidH (DUF202 family)
LTEPPFPRPVPDDTDEEEVAPGLAAERTGLAWVRTALAAAALATLATRGGDDPVSVLLAAVLGVAVVVPGVAACAMRVGALRAGDEVAVLRRRAAALLATSVALADVVALALIAR